MRVAVHVKPRKGWWIEATPEGGVALSPPTMRGVTADKGGSRTGHSAERTVGTMGMAKTEERRRKSKKVRLRRTQGMREGGMARTCGLAQIVGGGGVEWRGGFCLHGDGKGSGG